MSRRNKIIWAVVIAVLALLLLALLLWALSLKKAEPPVVVNQAPAANQAPLPGGGFGNVANVNEPANANAPAPTPKPVDSSLALKNLAKSFAERYGSYSSLGDSSNQTDLAPFMTAAFAAQTKAEVDKRNAAPPTDDLQFRGVTTRSIAVTVDALNEDGGTATLTVKTQRAEKVGDAVQPSVRYQDVTLTFAKEGGVWKVSKVAWK